jgi:hypothetical protein
MTARKKVYICFDYDVDRSLRDLLIGQARNAVVPFEISDKSLHEAVREKNWEEKARARISKADAVIVLVGDRTYRASGVLKEVKIARELRKKVVQLVGHKDRKCRRVPNGGIMYRWTWENLAKILGTEKQILRERHNRHARHARRKARSNKP